MELGQDNFNIDASIVEKPIKVQIEHKRERINKPMVETAAAAAATADFDRVELRQL